MGHFVKVMSTVLPRLKQTSAHNVAMASIALSGAVHLLIIPEQLSHSVAHGSFFAFIGVAQLVWALGFRWHPTAPLFYWAGVSLSGGMVITWLLAIFLSTPFSSHLEPVDAALMASNFLELIGLLTLIRYGATGAGAKVDRSPISRLVGRSLAASVIFGTVVWGGGQVGELILPGSADARAQGSAQSLGKGNPFDHEVVGARLPESVQENSASDSRPKLDLQAITSAAVDAAVVDLKLKNSGASPDIAPTPTPGLPSDIQAMIAVAVEAALGPDIAPTPTPGLPPDIQAMIAVAVEAALNPDLALIPTPGPLPGHQGMVAAAGTNVVDLESADLLDNAPGDNPGRESVPVLLPGRPATTVAPSPPTEVIESSLPEEKPSDLKMMLYGGALVALILVAVIGAVRTWNDIG